MFKVFEVRFKR